MALSKNTCNTRELLSERVRWRVSASDRPLLILCFSPDRIPGVSMILMLSRTGFGIWAHMNLQRKHRGEEEEKVKIEEV